MGSADSPLVRPEVPAALATTYRKNGWWQPDLLDRLVLRHSRELPDKCAVVAGERRLSYQELAEMAEHTANRLAAVGIRRGDRVLVQLPNGFELLVLVLALLRLGAPPVLALPALRNHELDQVVTTTQPAALAVPRRSRRFDHLQMAERLQQAHASVRLLLVTEHDRDDHISLSALLDAGTDSLPVPPPATDPSDIALFLLSSGTTGAPKAIPRTHEAYGHVVRTSAEVSGLTRESVYLAAMPATHSFVFGHPGILGTLAMGGRVVFTTPDSTPQLFALVEQERVTHCALVPALAKQWIEAGTAQHDLSSLGVLQVGGARLDPQTARALRHELGCQVQQVYGMSEGLLNFTRLDDPEEIVVQTQGRPASPGDELVVVDESGAPIHDNRVGELLTRGPSVIPGYYGAPAANAGSFTPEGFYRTGDLVRREPSGNLVVAGRVKDVINRGGEKIAADELEALVLECPGVESAAAVAMPHALLGEAVCLYIVAGNGNPPELRDVRKFLEQRGLARYKLPERLELLDFLPTRGVGKIDKVQLRKDIEERVSLEGSGLDR